MQAGGGLRTPARPSSAHRQAPTAAYEYTLISPSQALQAYTRLQHSSPGGPSRPGLGCRLDIRVTGEQAASAPAARLLPGSGCHPLPAFVAGALSGVIPELERPVPARPWPGDPVNRMSDDHGPATSKSRVRPNARLTANHYHACRGWTMPDDRAIRACQGSGHSSYKGLYRDCQRCLGRAIVDLDRAQLET